MTKLNEAIDEIRREETRSRASAGLDPLLKKMRWAFLKKHSNWTKARRARMRNIKSSALRPLRAFLLVEAFQHFWTNRSPTWADKFLDAWCAKIAHSRLDPLAKVARDRALYHTLGKLPEPIFTHSFFGPAKLVTPANKQTFNFWYPSYATGTKLAMNTASRAISLSVHSVDRLLDQDGSPLTCPRIHPEVASLICAEAEESGVKDNFEIVISVPAEDSSLGVTVAAAVHAHYAEEAAATNRELRNTLTRGWINFVSAILVIAALVFLAEWLRALGERRIYSLLGESLVIIGWVTMWRPAETFIFDQFPIRTKRRLNRALSKAAIKLVARTTRA